MRYPVVLKDVGYASTGFVPRNTSKYAELPQAARSQAHSPRSCVSLLSWAL